MVEECVANPRDEPLWMTEFGKEYQVPDEVTKLVDEGKLIDASWHDNISPHFDTAPEDTDTPGVYLWVEHPDPTLREYEGSRYYVDIHTADHTVVTNVMATDDIASALAAVVEHTPQSKEGELT